MGKHLVVINGDIARCQWCGVFLAVNQAEIFRGYDCASPLSNQLAFDYGE